MLFMCEFISITNELMTTSKLISHRGHSYTEIGLLCLVFKCAMDNLFALTYR